ncbi:MAG TPA: hypothetical protein VKQ08_04890 [Cyclobacteriaceae bacterium]|nr:hypothetical protein [Cyclobacteriaceae bacterium]
MKALALEDLGLNELSFDQQREINGGNPFWIGLGVGLCVKAVYDFLNGVYTGIQLEMADK